MAAPPFPLETGDIITLQADNGRYVQVQQISGYGTSRRCLAATAEAVTDNCKFTVYADPADNVFLLRTNNRNCFGNYCAGVEDFEDGAVVKGDSATFIVQDDACTGASVGPPGMLSFGSLTPKANLAGQQYQATVVLVDWKGRVLRRSTYLDQIVAPDEGAIYDLCGAADTSGFTLTKVGHKQAGLPFLPLHTGDVVALKADNGLFVQPQSMRVWNTDFQCLVASSSTITDNCRFTVFAYPNQPFYLRAFKSRSYCGYTYLSDWKTSGSSPAHNLGDCWFYVVGENAIVPDRAGVQGQLSFTLQEEWMTDSSGEFAEARGTLVNQNGNTLWRCTWDGSPGLIIAPQNDAVAGKLCAGAEDSSTFTLVKLDSGQAMAPIKNVFLLMLENRSFDHMLGRLSGGFDSDTGQQRALDGVDSEMTNTFQGYPCPSAVMTDWVMPFDPPHEFENVVVQLCGEGRAFNVAHPYPKIDMSGFVAEYSAASKGAVNPWEIMNGFDFYHLPVLAALKSQFLVCDRWFSGMPGPTFPNRLFAYAASSGSLDHSPTSVELNEWTIVDGFELPNGSIFDRLRKKFGDDGFRIYKSGIPIAMAGALKGITLDDVHSFDKEFAGHVGDPNYAVKFTLIEPDYGNFWGDFQGGSSMHPQDDPRKGEDLILAVYKALTNSPIWEQSLLIVTFDEHGGFYDHVVPPAAPPPNDIASKYNKWGFAFDQYGVRVPALIISPWVWPGNVDNRLYDHSSILATIEELFEVEPLTDRDRYANSLVSRLSQPWPSVLLPLGVSGAAWHIPPGYTATGGIEHELENSLAGGPLGNAVIFGYAAVKHAWELGKDKVEIGIDDLEDFGQATVSDLKTVADKVSQTWSRLKGFL